MPALNLSAHVRAALDRPIWSALTSTHRSLAEGTALARRYPAAISPLAAVSDDTDAAWADLAECASDDVVAVVSVTPLERVSGFEIRTSAAIRQMVAVVAAQDIGHVAIERLGLADVPAMLELTALTKPGPFLVRTHELGGYIGIRHGHRLAAMAGQRMRFDGFTEISAVCVHPDYRGKGYAQALVKSLMKTIAARGETPFLHTYDDNHGAIALYEHLGFASRATLCFTVLRRSGARF